MTVKNKYANRSKISEKKIRQIVKLFSIDLDASQITKISGLNRNTINRYLRGIRKELLNSVRVNLLLLEKLKLMKVSSALVELRAREAAVLSVKQLCSASSGAMEVSLLR